MDYLLWAVDRDSMLSGLNKLRLGLLYVEKGQAKLVMQSKEHRIFDNQTRVKTQAVVTQNIVVTEPEFYPGYFLTLRLTGRMLQRFCSTILPVELELRSLTNPGQVVE